MHALFFEVRPKPGHLDNYFEHVALLRPVLAQHTGLKFLDRYTARNDPDLLLSHQLWDSEDSIVAWRRDTTHRRSQSAGRQVHFEDYRIRVGERVLHWTATDHVAAAAKPVVSGAAHVLALYSTAPIIAPAFVTFESVNTKGMFVALATTDDYAAAETLLNDTIDAPGLDEGAIYIIRRDYGQFDRTQAPT